MVNESATLDVWPDKKFRLIGGELCLDFCNTVGGTREGIARENLHSYVHFLAWCEQVGLVKNPQLNVLREKAGRNAAEAGAGFPIARFVRESKLPNLPP